jgi:transposase, IS30 family
MQTYKTIQYEHRVLIAEHLRLGTRPSEIAKLLNFCRSVISREISRNSSTGSYHLYNANQAQKRANERSSNKGRKPKIVGNLKRKIDSYLKKDWSPEQIAGRTKRDGKQLASHETIYKYVYEDKAEGGLLFEHLRQTHRARYKRKNKTKKRGIIRDRVSISERPKIVEERIRLGDWEGDTIIGKGHKSAIATLVDRKSKETKIIKLKEKTAKETAKKISKKMKKSKVPIHTITFDNGKEFADHKIIAKDLKTDIYFADPYSAYQRGTNENTNGLIRQYLPKGTDFKNVTNEELKAIENKLNNRPRKSLDYLTPNEYIYKSVAINS